MGKNKTKNIEKNIKKEIEEKDGNGEVKSLLLITISVLLFLGLFYLLTVVILGDKSDNKKAEEETNEVEIQFDEVLVGSSFSIKDEEYFVLYYEFENEDINTELSSLVSNYRMSKESPYLYVVNMSDALNSKSISDKSKKDANNASELKINGPTLIKFEAGKIDDYIEGIDDITDELE